MPGWPLRRWKACPPAPTGTHSPGSRFPDGWCEVRCGAGRKRGRAAHRARARPPRTPGDDPRTGSCGWRTGRSSAVQTHPCAADEWAPGAGGAVARSDRGTGRRRWAVSFGAVRRRGVAVRSVGCSHAFVGSRGHGVATVRRGPDPPQNAGERPDSGGVRRRGVRVARQRVRRRRAQQGREHRSVSCPPTSWWTRPVAAAGCLSGWRRTGSRRRRKRCCTPDACTPHAFSRVLSRTRGCGASTSCPTPDNRSARSSCPRRTIAGWSLCPARPVRPRPPTSRDSSPSPPVCRTTRRIGG